MFIVGAALAAGAGVAAWFFMPQVDLDSKEKELNAVRDSVSEVGGGSEKIGAGNGAEKAG